MKIGILTFHDGFNFGAYLQVYSQHKFLLSQGIENEIINYKNFRHWWEEYKVFLCTKNPVTLFTNIIKIFKFKKEHDKLKFSKFTFDVSNTDEYDLIIVGSDEIWNYNNPLFGLDEVYFSKSLKFKKIISYAASFGTVNCDEALNENVKKCLNSFSSISVRDTNSKCIIEKNLSKKPIMTVDPTFLIEFNDLPAISTSNYILVYGAGFSDTIIKEAIALSRNKNKQLLSVGYKNKWCDRNIIGIDPFTWMSYMKNADFIVTTMFHGTMFSVKFRRNFILELTPYRKNKLVYFLDKFNLDSIIYNKEKSVEDMYNTGINYADINNKLEDFIKESKEYLLDNINELK
ncbi:polysaccharide pyruvyl transferase family protein [Sulfurimonas sp.]|uniref:polysaccharide pyruvyl transferase family protein n=1 Tax=Sulfurimonas sp. TaxID=2022749 RepID=UPI002603EB9E|nr:polysaccharide pyruvyl transferase family protein [Sulfurimonas sp.]MCW8895345.1 polysaccharide pyruvyl transferase family protein [Sulfurimonas sp.]